MIAHGMETLQCGLLSIVVFCWAAIAFGESVKRDPRQSTLRFFAALFAQVILVGLIIYRVWNGRVA